MSADNFMHLLMRKRSRAKIRWAQAKKQNADPNDLVAEGIEELFKSREHLDTVETILAAYREFKKKKPK